MFSTQDAAIKWNISLQLLVGTLLPLMALTASVATGGQQAFQVMMTVMYFTVPMFTFYLTNYWIFIDYIK
jgi:ABC-type multidrug transport system fused ATPase/permease subunit